MRRWIFILISILTLSACHSGGQKDDALSDVDIKVIRYDRLQYEAFALNSFSALQKMSTECPQATKLLIERVLEQKIRISTSGCVHIILIPSCNGSWKMPHL